MAMMHRPTIPAPETSTVAPVIGPRPVAARRAAAAVAVAHETGARMAAGISSGTRVIPEPAFTCTWVAKPPLSSQPRPMRSWPYFRIFSHFCGKPRPHVPHSPQLTVTVQTTLSPTARAVPSCRTASGVAATTRPTCSWPSTRGGAALRWPEVVWMSDPQIVAYSTSTRASPALK